MRWHARVNNRALPLPACAILHGNLNSADPGSGFQPGAEAPTMTASVKLTVTWLLPEDLRNHWLEAG